MSGAPDLPDASRPFFDRTPGDRAGRACTVKFVDAVGTHLICPRAACRREARCTDRDMGALPFCWEQHRGLLRFLLCVAARRHGVRPGAAASGDAVAMPEPFRGQPLLAGWAAAGMPIETFARSIAEGPDDWTWEAIPAMQDLFRELTGAGGPAHAPQDSPPDAPQILADGRARREPW